MGKRIFSAKLVLPACFVMVGYFAIAGMARAAGSVSLPTGLGMMQEGSLLDGTPSYQWWYGCSPTAAGMLMGYYDVNGYGGLQYGNLVAGGTASSSTFPSTAGNWNYLAESAIASPGHVEAFYSAGYNASGDDNPLLHTGFDSLADFMGTSQDLYGNSNGMTTFYYRVDGSPMYVKDIFSGNLQGDGMYGIWEYEDYRGYGSHDASTDTSIFTQLTDNQGKAYGFTFADYVSEIDAGREVIIHVNGHDMVGFGYGDNDLVYLYDTWNQGTESMTWGGSYAGMEMWGVTCFTPSGGSNVPIPAAAWLFGSGLLGMLGFRRKMLRA
jgi:hypothetical protein